MNLVPCGFCGCAPCRCPPSPPTFTTAATSLPGGHGLLDSDRIRDLERRLSEAEARLEQLKGVQAAELNITALKFQELRERLYETEKDLCRLGDGIDERFERLRADLATATAPAAKASGGRAGTKSRRRAAPPRTRTRDSAKPRPRPRRGPRRRAKSGG